MFFLSVLLFTKISQFFRRSVLTRRGVLLLTLRYILWKIVCKFWSFSTTLAGLVVQHYLACFSVIKLIFLKEVQDCSSITVGLIIIARSAFTFVSEEIQISFSFFFSSGISVIFAKDSKGLDRWSCLPGVWNSDFWRSRKKTSLETH